jgi:hypothetical protein
MGEDPDKDPSAPAAASSRAMVLPRLLCLRVVEEVAEEGPDTDVGTASMGGGGKSDTTVELSALKV